MFLLKSCAIFNQLRCVYVFNASFTLRMKREFKSWEECINLREVKVGKMLCIRTFHEMVILVPDENEAH